MARELQARRLNGTDLGKTLDLYGAIRKVTHDTITVEGEDKPVRLVFVTTNRGEFALFPAQKISFTTQPEKQDKK